jgi:hypothetical protein
MADAAVIIPVIFEHGGLVTLRMLLRKIFSRLHKFKSYFASICSGCSDYYKQWMCEHVMKFISTVLMKTNVVTSSPWIVR